jgi:hypothetical protein
MAPFLSQFVQEAAVLNLSPRLLTQRLSFLASAAQVEWWPAQSSLSWGPFMVDEHISSPILRTLSESTTLRSLELTQIEVKPYYQQVILRIPTLRKLTLCDAIFTPTPMALPLTSIRVLVLRSLRSEQTPMAHLSRCLAGSLETLEIDSNCADTDVYNLFSILELTTLQSFASIRIPLSALRRSIFHPFLRHAFITTLHISVEHAQFLSPVFPDTFLPKLRRLSAPWSVAESLIPGRPVQVFRDIGLQVLDMPNLENMLVQLAASASGIEELELCSSWNSPGIFTLFVKHLPYLKRLRLLIGAQTHYYPRQVKSYMAMEPKFGVQCPSLREIEIRVQVPPENRLLHQVSRTNCRILSKLFIPICPALKVLTFIITDSRFNQCERDIPLRHIFKLRRMVNGEWEERGFGIETQEGAIDYPSVEYRS